MIEVRGIKGLGQLRGERDRIGGADQTLGLVNREATSVGRYEIRERFRAEVRGEEEAEGQPGSEAGAGKVHGKPSNSRLTISASGAERSPPPVSVILSTRQK